MKYLKLLLIFFIYSNSNSNQEDITIFSKKFNGISIFIKDGHAALTRSVINGLEKLKIPHNVNPRHSKDIYDVAFCLAGIDLLKRSIKLKNEGKIKKLLVGPNMMGRSHDYSSILENPAIDNYLTPCSWNYQVCLEDLPSLYKKMLIWPAGIDSDYWRPYIPKPPETKDVLIYWKSNSQDFCNQVSQVLIRYGWHPILIKYGNYTLENYKNILNKTKFAVFISRSESQGLALAECWAMNIPTLVWDPQEPFYELGRTYANINSCPYLTEYTGKSWKKIDELEDILKTMNSYWDAFNPRKWVLNNMTDEVSINLLLKIINE